MTMTTTLMYRRWAALQPSEPQLVGQVTTVHGDGTATVTMPGGGQLRARNPLAAEASDHVFLQAGVITGPAPAMTVVDVEV